MLGYISEQNVVSCACLANKQPRPKVSPYKIRSSVKKHNNATMEEAASISWQEKIAKSESVSIVRKQKPTKKSEPTSIEGKEKKSNI